jgi:hypothetical protein
LRAAVGDARGVLGVCALLAEARDVLSLVRLSMPGLFVSTALLATLMVAQAALGRMLSHLYRDPPLIAATWVGNDWVTLLVAVPALGLSARAASAGSTRGLLLWLAVVWYGVYNTAFYLFGAALNAFLPLYAATWAAAIVVLARGLMWIDAASVAAAFDRRMPTRALGAALAAIGAGLAAAWTGMWAAHVFAGRPTPADPEAFKIVAALDLSLMVPALVGGGVLLWRRQPWGFVVATLASVQGALYLLVLLVNSLLVIARGLVPPPGEVPLWGALALVTGAIAARLLSGVTERQRDLAGP